ncbi:MAG: TVP38/TMEM64 family protein [Candidatus Sumerlaeia bacterium]
MVSSDEEQVPIKGGGKVKLVIIAVLAIGLFAAGILFRDTIRGWMDSFQAWVESIGVWGPLAVIAAYIVACVFFISGAALTLVAGAIFGVVKGAIIVSIGSTLGAAVAFLVGRFFAREMVEKKVEANEKFQVIDRAVEKKGFKIVFLTRLSPVFPFVLQNYAYGLTAVRFWPYVLASWVGMLPGTVMFVYLGDVGRKAAETTTGAASVGQTVLQVVGLVATIAVVVVVTRIAKKALAEKTELNQEEV